MMMMMMMMMMMTTTRTRTSALGASNELCMVYTLFRVRYMLTRSLCLLINSDQIYLDDSCS